MAHSHINMLVVIATMLLPSIVTATEFVVGDHHGWATGFNYSAWAEGKVFLVGDTLLFSYETGQHNVFKVNQTAFESCTVPSNKSEALTTGSDTIVLATPGKKWYLCGVGEHCTTGQKLAITVHPLADLPPSPQPIPIPVTPISDSPAPSPEPDDQQQYVPHFGKFVPKKRFLNGFH